MNGKLENLAPPSTKVDRPETVTAISFATGNKRGAITLVAKTETQGILKGYLDAFKVNRVHHGTLKELDSGVVPLQQAFQLQIGFFPKICFKLCLFRLNGEKLGREN